MKKLIILFLITNLVTACSSAHVKKNNPSKVKYNVTSSQTKAIINNAKAMIGVDYYYGGISPKTGFDCSGLVYYSHKKQGIVLPRTTSGQYSRVKKVYKSKLRPGDLVFFAINRINVSHVGIYLGNNKFIHSPSSGKKVNISSMDTEYWRKRYISGGRI